MYRAPSPQPMSAGLPLSQPFNPGPSPGPAGNETVPGSIMYTTSYNEQGQMIYHPYKAVSASYQTPSGVVTGIQWIPAEATSVLPANAQPANSEFAASWARGGLDREEEKRLSQWQKDEDKRRRREEKESQKQLRERERMSQTQIDDLELRRAREKDAQIAAARERRKSFSGPSPAPGVSFPGVGGGVAGSLASPTSPYLGASPRVPSPNLGGATGLPYTSGGGAYPPFQAGTAASAGGYPQDRGLSAGGGLTDMERQMGDLNLDRSKEFGSSGLGRPQKYAAAETMSERARRVSGNFGTSPIPGTYPSSTTNAYPPFSSQPAAPTPSYPPAGPGNPIPPTMVGGYPPSGALPGGATGYSPFQGRSPQNSTAPFGASGIVPGQVYPPGHVMEGQPMTRSHPTTPAPGGATGYLPGIGAQYAHSGHGSYPSTPAPDFHRSPDSGYASNMTEQGQLAAPEGFSRPPNQAQPYTPFEPMKIQDMEEFLEVIPKMPLVLQTHDVYHEDWIRLMQDISLAWAGRLPVPDLQRMGRLPKKSTLTTDLIELWNQNFFAARGIEIILYKGRERRSGPQAGLIDLQFDYEDELSDSGSSESSTDSEVPGREAYGLGAGGYGVYGRQSYGLPPDALEARRRRKESKMERRRRRKEKKIRRKVRAREKKYGLYMISTPLTSTPASGAIPGPGIVSGPGYGPIGMSGGGPVGY